MTGPDHEKFVGYASLYAVGALNAPERLEFEQHLELCRPCVDEVMDVLPVAQGLAQAVPLREPPVSLRTRVLEHVTGKKAPLTETDTARPATAGSPVRPVSIDEARGRREERARGSRIGSILFGLAAAACLVAAAGLGWFASDLLNRNRALQQSLEAEVLRANRAALETQTTREAVTRAEATVAILTAPDVVVIALAGQPVAPQATGRAFWSPSRGLVFTAANLPALPANRVYQLWFVTPPNPISAGLLSLDNQGRVATTIPVPANLTAPVTLAVTIESAGGVPAPTGEMYLMGQPPAPRPAD